MWLCATRQLGVDGMSSFETAGKGRKPGLLTLTAHRFTTGDGTEQ